MGQHQASHHQLITGEPLSLGWKQKQAEKTVTCGCRSAEPPSSLHKPSKLISEPCPPPLLSPCRPSQVNHWLSRVQMAGARDRFLITTLWFHTLGITEDSTLPAWPPSFLSLDGEKKQKKEKQRQDNKVCTTEKRRGRQSQLVRSSLSTGQELYFPHQDVSCSA